jgi:AraC-like DNA-binding protein
MAREGCASRAVMVSATPLPQEAGATLHWDGRSGVCRVVGPPTCSGPAQRSSFQAMSQPATGNGARPYWTTSEIGLVPSLSPQAIAWEQEAARVTFSLDPVLLTETARGVIPKATGELVWVPWQETTESCTPAVHPVLLMHSPYDTREADRVMIVPSLPAHDPLLQHIALVLQVAIAGQGVEGQLYAASLVDALAVHFLKRYVAARPALQEVTGGLSPYKLRRTIAYIQAHLAQELSLATLAAVAQTSPAHFARLFKHATGLAPHQYVIRSRMAHARRLLAATDVSLIDIGLQVGCADQSHFTALFRTHVAQTPKAFRDHARRAMSGDARGTSSSARTIVARFQHG